MRGNIEQVLELKMIRTGQDLEQTEMVFRSLLLMQDRFG